MSDKDPNEELELADAELANYFALFPHRLYDALKKCEIHVDENEKDSEKPNEHRRDRSNRKPASHR